MARRRYRAEAANAEAVEETREQRAARIDAEPKPARQPQLSVGTQVWFIDAGRWFLLEVVAKAATRGRKVTFKSVTGWDAAREVEWGLGLLFEFPVHSPLYQRLRPLSARRP